MIQIFCFPNENPTFFTVNYLMDYFVFENVNVLN